MGKEHSMGKVSSIDGDGTTDFPHAKE